MEMQTTGNATATPAWDLEVGSWDLNVVAFCCHHCAYAAADLAGAMRLEYPTAVKIVELPCTGKLDVLYVLRAFEDGADGVLVAG
jgi:coenzyme F420-reducing hydrogenase delta subunit